MVLPFDTSQYFFIKLIYKRKVRAGSLWCKHHFIRLLYFSGNDIIIAFEFIPDTEFLQLPAHERPWKMDYTSSQKSFPCQYAIQNHAKGCQTILASTKHYFFGSVCFYTEWFYTEWLNKLYWSSFSACSQLPQTIISTFNSIYSNALIDWAKRIAHLLISIYIYNLGSVIFFFFWGGGIQFNSSLFV